MTLIEACLVVMYDPEVKARYPEGMIGHEVLHEVRAHFGEDAFPLASTLDVIDELREYFGED